MFFWKKRERYGYEEIDDLKRAKMLLEESINISKEIGWRRPVILSMIASKFIEMGEIERARELLDEAIQTVIQLEGGIRGILFFSIHEFSQALAAIAIELIKIEENERAFQIAMKIKNRWEQLGYFEDMKGNFTEPVVAKALASISSALAKVGEIDKAEKISVEAINISNALGSAHLSVTLQALISVITELVKSAVFLESFQFIKTIIRSAEGILDPEERLKTLKIMVPEVSKVLGDIASTFIEWGLIKKGFLNTSEAEDKKLHTQIMAVISPELSKIGKNERVNEVAKKLELVIRELKGSFEDLIRITKKIDNKFDRSDALIVIAYELSRAGEIKSAEKMLEEAIQTYEDAKYSSKYVKALMGIAYELFRIGEVEKVEKILEEAIQIARATKIKFKKIETIPINEIFSKVECSKSLVCIASKLIVIEKIERAKMLLEEAINISKEIEDKYYRSKALTTVASKFIEIGEIERAREILKEAIQTSKKIKDKESRSLVLITIASEFVKLSHKV